MVCQCLRYTGYKSMVAKGFGLGEYSMECTFPLNHRRGMIIFLLFVTLVLGSSCSNGGGQPPKLEVTYVTPDPIDQERSRVLYDFLIGMKEKDVTALRSVVHSDAWPKVEAWLAEREPVMCRSNLFNEEQSFGGKYAESDTRWVGNWYFSLSCPGQNPKRAVYSLGFEDLEMQAQNQTWVIVDWKTVSEVWK
jgi:hypothetical protein